MDRRTLLGYAVASVLAGHAAEALRAAPATPDYPDTPEGQQARLDALTARIEAGFTRQEYSNKRGERHVIHSGLLPPSMDVVEERVYIHKTYCNGLMKPDGMRIWESFPTSPRAAVDDFEHRFLPDAARHSGAILWRIRPGVREIVDFDGVTRYAARCRCSFLDSPDEIIRFPERTLSNG
jgi:hypothetical protein